MALATVPSRELALHRSPIVFLIILTDVVTVTPAGRFRRTEGLDETPGPGKGLLGFMGRLHLSLALGHMGQETKPQF